MSGGRWALGRDSEGRSMGPEGVVVKAAKVFIKGGGTNGEDSVFRVDRFH